MRKTVCIGFVTAGLTVLSLNCAPKPTEKELSGKIKGKMSLRLADGSPISTDEADEYNPYIVKLSDDYLVVVFGSNRTCGGSCSGHNIFMAKSISPYSGLTLPFFNTPVAVKDGVTPLNLTNAVNFAAVANTTNVVLYVNDNLGDIQKGTISNPGNPTAGFTAINNTAILSYKVIGITSAGSDLVVTDSGGTSYTANPNVTESPTAYGFALDSALSATQVRLDNTGYDDSYMAVTGFEGFFTTPIATTKAFPFGPIINFDLALLSSGLSITHINTLYGDTAENDIILFSARDEVSNDLYVVTSHTSKALWDEVASFGGDTMGPPPPDHWFGFDGMTCPTIFDMGIAVGWSATCVGTPTITVPSYNPLGEFALFSGSEAIDLGTEDFNSNAAGFTIAAWIKVSGSCTSLCTIAANASSGAFTDGFRFYYDYNGAAGRLAFRSADGVASATAFSTTSLISQDNATWYHVAVVTDPSVGGYANLYLDGNFVGQTTAIQSGYATLQAAAIGQMTDNQNRFFGGIDDFMVFEYPLFDEEIEMLAFGF